MASKQEIGEQNVAALKRYIESKKAKGEGFPVQNGKLFMTGIYRELVDDDKAARAPSWFNTNEKAVELLNALREDMANDGILGHAASASAKTDKQVKQLEGRVMQLENRMAALKAENEALKAELGRRTLADQHLISTGRMLR